MILWHDPLITPAQGAIIFAVCLALYGAGKVVAWFLREPSVEVERFENVDGEGR